MAVTLATALVHAVSVLLGAAFGARAPTAAIQVVAGLAFLGFAAWTLRGDELDEDDEATAARTGRSAVLTSATAFFLAELGDKTMLATITLANDEGARSASGSARPLGMVAADALAIGVGALLGTRLPERAVRLFAAAAFVVFGVLLIAQGFGLP